MCLRGENTNTTAEITSTPSLRLCIAINMTKVIHHIDKD